MPGEIVNLSEFGMAIETLIDLPLGYELTFRLRRKAGSMELSGWIRWCRRVRTISTADGRELPVFHSGVEFNGSTVEAVRRCADALLLWGETAEGTPEGVSGLRSLR